MHTTINQKLKKHGITGKITNNYFYIVKWRSEIPQRAFADRKVYDLENSIGAVCKFICGNVSGILEIVGYDAKTHLLSVSYNHEINTIKTDEFRLGKIRTLIGIRTNKFKVEIGDTFVDEHRNLSILSRRYTKDSNGRLWKEYQYHCHKCNWTDGWIAENHLLKGVGCSCCSKHTIVPFVNDLYTTNPELIKYFKNIEDTHKTTTCNKKKLMMVCSNCKNEQLYSTDDLMNHGFSCRKCGDGISYGEKYMYSLLKQLGVDFKRCLINDPIKEQLAKENHIDNYIHIDCSKSDGTYIKESIITSGLLSILGTNEKNVNWNDCEKFSSKSFVVLVCDYKNTHPELSSREIGIVFDMARTTIQKYLQRGFELGICIYDKEFEKRYTLKEARIKHYSNVA